MAKAQKTFASKATKHEAKAEKRQIRLIRSIADPNTGTVKYLDRMVSVPGDENLDSHLAKLMEDKP
jgi:hypothetical protein